MLRQRTALASRSEWLRGGMTTSTRTSMSRRGTIAPELARRLIGQVTGRAARLVGRLGKRMKSKDGDDALDTGTKTPTAGGPDVTAGHRSPRTRRPVAGTLRASGGSSGARGGMTSRTATANTPRRQSALECRDARSARRASTSTAESSVAATTRSPATRAVSTSPDVSGKTRMSSVPSTGTAGSRRASAQAEGARKTPEAARRTVAITPRNARH